MLITDIKELNKNKSLVYIDYNMAFALYKGEIKKYRIKKNEEIHMEHYEELLNIVLVKRAKLRLMNLLKCRDYTKYQLKEKLRQGYYPQNVIEKAIEYVQEYGYVDDLKYAESFIRNSAHKKSLRQIELDLISKGIPKDDIKLCLEEYYQESEAVKEEELIKKLLNKKNYINEQASEKEQQKIISFLYRKGFSLDKIYKVIREND